MNAEPPRALAVVLALALLACAPESSDRAIWLLPSSTAVTIGNETRLGVWLRANAPRRRFEVTLPEDPVLALGFGITKANPAVEVTPVTFTVALETDGGKRELLASRRFDPSPPVRGPGSTCRSISRPGRTGG